MLKKISLLALFSAYLYANFTIDNKEIFWLSKDENITFLDDINISTDAILKSDFNGSITLHKDWINYGNFIGNNINVNIKGENKSTIYGDNIFYTLSAQKSLVLESFKRQKILDTLSLNDGELSSTVDGAQSILDLSLTKKIDTKNLAIQDSKIIGLAEAINPPNSIDNGNNILWFSYQNDCQNIDSKYSWLNKYSCDEDEIKYIVNKDIISSEIVLDTLLDIDTIKEIPIKTSQDDIEGIYINYKDITSKSCSKDIKITIYKDGKTNTGYEADKTDECFYEDPTLQNWDYFKDSAKINIYQTTQAEKQNHEDANSVIVIDVNLTQTLIIGEKNDTK